MHERGWTYWQPLSQLARLAEELGELARIVNHLYGEKPKKPGEAEQELGLEMADILYTMICLANSQGIDLQDAFEQALQKYRMRDATRYTDSGTSQPAAQPADPPHRGAGGQPAPDSSGPHPM
jgi:NTP pyrophosphatase (non-canonical NTP hydrolase)